MLTIFKKIASLFTFSRSDLYWQKRYKEKGNSGSGSYGDLAIFKAEVFNDFVVKEKINSVIDFGCGDSNQIALFKVDNYLGLDIAQEAIAICKSKFKDNSQKEFLVYDYKNFRNDSRADLVISMDVIFHLVEDDIYNNYMKDLFASADNFVMIYSSNSDNNSIFKMRHVRDRNFTKWINKNQKNWQFYKKIDNKFPDNSRSSFYFFKKS